MHTSRVATTWGARCCVAVGAIASLVCLLAIMVREAYTEAEQQHIPTTPTRISASTLLETPVSHFSKQRLRHARLTAHEVSAHWRERVLGVPSLTLPRRNTKSACGLTALPELG